MFRYYLLEMLDWCGLSFSLSDAARLEGHKKKRKESHDQEPGDNIKHDARKPLSARKKKTNGCRLRKSKR